jgi:hypothetical protein
VRVKYIVVAGLVDGRTQNGASKPGKQRLRTENLRHQAVLSQPDTPSRDHLTADAQGHIIHDRYSHVPAVALAAQEMQEWAIEQQEHG